jgi:endonuclease YncB( thermonuclease family)
MRKRFYLASVLTFSFALAISAISPTAVAVPFRPMELQPEHHWVVIRTAADMDKITMVLDKKEFPVILSNVLPISRWPEDGGEAAKKLKTEALKFLPKKLAGEKIWYLRGYLKMDKDESLRGDLIRMWADDWPGGTPASVGWGMTWLNAFAIQEGLSVYLPDDTIVLGPQETNLAKHEQSRKDKLQAAERFAEEHKKGIWQNREFALRVRAAARRSERSIW